MNLSRKAVWQQAAGDTVRDYADICLKWGVILNGPGYAGAWPACADRLKGDDRSARKITDLRRFAEEMADGDVVVLRLGTSKVVAVGQIVGPYVWHSEFGDVDGWDLEHVRRVRWLWSCLESPKTFAKYALKQGDTTQRVTSPTVTEWLGALTLHTPARVPSIPQLPEVGSVNEISVDTVSEFLFNHGVASNSISNLISEVGELTRIAMWYRHGHMPSEHETVAYLVVPLLRALGWTPQRMAVEWNKVDLALFDRLPRRDESLEVVVEAKKMGQSCLSAKSQAQRYAQGKTGCKRLIVTDGIRYGVYVRDVDGSFSLHAYLNLTRLRHEYPIYACRGAEDALLAMAPEWRSSSISEG